jgi:hypothetical protein
MLLLQIKMVQHVEARTCRTLTRLSYYMCLTCTTSLSTHVTTCKPPGTKSSECRFLEAHFRPNLSAKFTTSAPVFLHRRKPSGKSAVAWSFASKFTLKFASYNASGYWLMMRLATSVISTAQQSTVLSVYVPSLLDYYYWCDGCWHEILASWTYQVVELYTQWRQRGWATAQGFACLTPILT